MQEDRREGRRSVASYSQTADLHSLQMPPDPWEKEGKKRMKGKGGEGSTASLTAEDTHSYGRQYVEESVGGNET